MSPVSPTATITTSEIQVSKYRGKYHKLLHEVFSDGWHKYTNQASGKISFFKFEMDEIKQFSTEQIKQSAAYGK